MTGWDNALPLLLDGESIDAIEAKRIGLVNEVIEPNEETLAAWIETRAQTLQVAQLREVGPIADGRLDALRTAFPDDAAKQAILDILETLTTQGIEVSWDASIVALALLTFSDRAKRRCAVFDAKIGSFALKIVERGPDRSADNRRGRFAEGRLRKPDEPRNHRTQVVEGSGFQAFASLAERILGLDVGRARPFDGPHPGNGLSLAGPSLFARACLARLRAGPKANKDSTETSTSSTRIQADEEFATAAPSLERTARVGDESSDSVSTLTTPKSRRGKGKGRVRVLKAVPEPTHVAWVKVGPNQFVRVEKPGDASSYEIDQNMLSTLATTVENDARRGDFENLDARRITDRERPRGFR